MKRLAPLFFFLVIGCVLVPPTPETARERYAAAEVSYKASLLTISDLTRTGTIRPGSNTAKKVAAAVRTARAGLDGWGVRVDAHDAEIAAMASLNVLQAVLKELQR